MEMADSDTGLVPAVLAFGGARASRRRILGWSALAFLTTGLVAACQSAPASPTPAARATVAAGPTVATGSTVAAGSTGTAKSGGELKIGTTTEGVSMHPFKVTDTPSFAYIDNMFLMPLLRYDPDTLELKPFVASAVKESSDHTTVTFTLRDNLLWSDGQPLTAADYAWTWEQASKPENKWPRLGSYTPYVASVKDVDAKTLEVKLKTVLAISLEKASSALAYVLPRHIWEKLDWSDPNKNAEILKPSVVAGPYKLVEWKKDDHATFDANDHFFLGRPHIDKLSFRIYGNANVATQALMSGAIDQYGPEPENWADVKKNPKLNAYQWDSPDAAVTYIGLDLRQDALKDKAVRQALNYALDKDKIVDKLTYGLGKRATTMYLPTSWVYAPDANAYPYDQEKAKRMLDEAGWKVGANGVREKAGKPLKLQFIYGPNTTPVREQLALIAQEAWKAVGADVAVKGMEWGAYLKVTKEGPYDWSAFVNAYIASIDPDIIWWKKNAGPAYNRADYHNPKVEDLYEQGLKELDREKRKAIYQDIERALSEDSPWIWLYYEQGKQAINKRVQGIRVTKALGLNDVWEWSIA